MPLNSVVPQQRINIRWMNSALGDSVCFFPILKILVERDLIESILMKGDQFKDILGLIVPPQRIIVAKENCRYKSNYGFVDSFRKYPSSIHTHLVDWASLTLSDCILSHQERTMPLLGKDIPDFYYDYSFLPSDYICLQCGYTSKLKAMPQSTFDEIIQYCIDNKIYVVLLGKEYDIPIDNEDPYKIRPNEFIKELRSSEYVINLINKTTLLDSLKIIQKSKAMVGMDSGLIHLAGLTETPIVAAYTHKSPEYLMPIRHRELGWNVYPIVPDHGVCKFCMTEYFNQFEYDYKNCAKGNTECCDNITADKFIEQIKKII